MGKLQKKTGGLVSSLCDGLQVEPSGVWEGPGEPWLRSLGFTNQHSLEAQRGCNILLVLISNSLQDRGKKAQGTRNYAFPLVQSKATSSLSARICQLASVSYVTDDPSVAKGICRC